MTARDLLTDALLELNVIASGENPAAADLALALVRLNRLLDRWNGTRRAVWTDVFATQPITPGLNPHTIGPTGATWTVPQRPITIESLTLLRGGLRYPITGKDRSWYTSLTNQALTGSLPTYAYYETDWPNGKLFLWPVPSGADDLELSYRVLLSSVGLDTLITLPPAYEDAIAKTLVEEIAVPFSRPLPPDYALRASMARKAAFDNNSRSPRITSDAAAGRSGFDFRTGLPR